MKILYVTTISDTMNAFLIPHIEMLIGNGYQVDVAFNIKKKVDKKIINLGCKIYKLDFQRNPLSIKNYGAFRDLKLLINRRDYDVIHTHTPVASVLTRLACRKNENIKVFYTAHGFHFYKGALFLNWIMYYPIEWFLSKYTHTLITINKEDYTRAKKSFKAKNIEYIPGVGLDINKFEDIYVDKSRKRKELEINDDKFLVLSVGEINKNKNHETILKAISNLNNDDIHYIICGEGKQIEYLKELSEKLGIAKQVHCLGYRTDIGEICKICDIFAFPSLREGLGMAALEAMICGMPIITSNVHGILDYSINGVTGFTCNPKDVECFANSINKIYENRELLKQFGKTNKDMAKKYGEDRVISKLYAIYSQNLDLI